MTNARVLIVEDEGIEALDLQHRLTSLGYNAPDIAATGEEAVIKAGEIRPDLILMDIMLRGEMDGVTAAGQIHERFDIPVIFITAYADDDTLRRAKITVPYGYLVKPFKEKDLHISIDMALYKHKMERELKESRKWFATTLSSIGDAVIATDKDGLITFMNPVAEGLMGWKLVEISNKKLTDVFNIINKDTRRPVENPISRVIREGVTVGLANHTILIARDGTEMPIDDSAAPIKDDRENIIGVVLVFRDVTERKRLEEDLQRYANELESVNNDLESFSYGISHELKAPLRSIEGFAQAISEDYAGKLDEMGKDYFNRIVSASKRMSQQIEALLTMSRLTRSELTKKTVNLSEMAAVMASELKRSQPMRDVKFIIAEKVKVQGDMDMLRIVMENLLANAWKFTSKREGASIEFGAFESQGDRVFYVRDNGIGFDMSYAERLFQPFKRFHSEAEFSGLGIGLATVYKIISKHGGKIWAESEAGKGALFCFTL